MTEEEKVGLILKGYEVYSVPDFESKVDGKELWDFQCPTGAMPSDCYFLSEEAAWRAALHYDDAIVRYAPRR